MTTKSHKTLTGTQLHEPKGADAAAVNKVYVSDGAGSGAWQKLTASQLQTTGNPFGAQLFHVQEQRTSGTAGTAVTTGSWQTKSLTTSVTNEITSASLASNQLSLPSGTYFISGIYRVIGTSSGLLKTRLRNITDGATLVIGTQGQMSGGGGVGATSEASSTIDGRFTISGTKTIELQYYATTGASIGAASTGEVEIYADLFVWKVA